MKNKINIPNRAFVLFCFFVLFVQVCLAQETSSKLSVIPRVGITLSNISDWDVHVDVNNTDKVSKSKTKIGITAGADVEYRLHDYIGVSAGVNYSLQGSRNPKVGHYSGSNTHLHYINFPIMIKGYLGSGFSLHTGVQFGWKVAEKVGDVDDASVFKNSDVSIPVGGDYEFNHYIVSAQYNIGITKIPTINLLKSKNQVFQLTLGYRI